MNGPTILGKLIVLRPATADDRRDIYEWLAHSDVARFLAGPPLYPEIPTQTWEEFLDDYTPNYFNDSAPLMGRCFMILAGGKAVGQINYGQILGPENDRRVELDIWMRSESDCGRGYGPDALDALCRYLNREFGVGEFLVRPSARNPRAIRAYEKAGFVRLDLSLEEVQARWGVGEYLDGISLIKKYL